MDLLAKILVELKEVKNAQELIMIELRMSDANKMKHNFYVKYKLDLPFKTSKDFMEFDTKLSENDGFKTEFTTALHLLIDRERNLMKFCTSVLKKYLARDVAMTFTAARQIKDKTLFRSTTFCEIIIGMEITNYTNTLNATSLQLLFPSALSKREC